MLSKKLKYGIHALLHLAKVHGKGPVLIVDIAEEEQIPRKFLEAILLDLRNGGILGSRKGKGGGYYLIKDPNEVKMVDVMRIIDGPVALLPCVSLNYYERCAECKDEVTCAIRDVFLQIRVETLRVLENATLATMLAAENRLFKEKTN